MRNLLLVLAILFGLTFASPAIAAPAPSHIYTTASAAQHHCPSDTVVWLNLPSGIYHYAGERWYGRTNDGAYVCEKEAIKAGDRATRNGQ
jgi:hypothetical protein